MHGIPVPPLWVRRVQRVLWPLVGVLVSVVAGFACVVSLVLWPIDRRMRLARFALAITEALWADIRLTVACWRLWLRHPRGDSPTWRADHQELLVRTLNSVIGAGQRYLGLRVRFAGPVDLNSPHIPDLVLARHAGPADSLILAWLLTHEAVRLPRVVLTEGLRWDPGVDIVLSRLDSYFVPSVTGAGDDRVDRVRELARSLQGDESMLLFPEGQNWTPARREQLIERLIARGDDDLAVLAELWEWVLPPRPGGVMAALSARPDADVVVVGHTGLELLTTPLAIWRAIPLADHGHEFVVRTHTYVSGDVPHQAEPMARWLIDRWGEMNDWIAAERSGDVD